MAKILVPETSSQLSLSLEGKWDWTGENSIENVSPRLRRHIFKKTHERLHHVFRSITYTTIAEVIKASGTTESYFVGRNRRVVEVKQLIIGLLPYHEPQAVVGLYTDLRGPSSSLNNIYTALLDQLKMPPDLRRTLAVGEGRINAIVPIFPVVKVKVGSFEKPPVFDSFVLSQELSDFCAQLKINNRQYAIVPAAA